jgi:hypothetical protein
MRTARPPTRGRRRSAQRTLLGPAVLGPAALATALVATAAVGVIAGRPVAALSTATQGAIEARAVVGKAATATTAKTPGWRVVATVGPGNEAVTGTVSADSATSAWSVWTGTDFTAVERLKGARWSQVPLPAALTAYARSAVAFGGDSATDFWLFNSRSATHVLRFTGVRWTLQPIPSWVLQRQPGAGELSVSAAVFGPDNVWVFGLRADAYAAHYDGRGWSRVRLPTAPDAVTAVSADDIWALHGSVAWNWNGENWTGSEIPRAAGNPPESFDNLTATGPRSAWVWRSVRGPGRPTEVDQLHWNGTSWQRAGAGTPADLIDSVVPDGSGGLWATGVDVNPGGFNRFYHLAGGRWKQASPPGGSWDQQPESLTWIPGTHSVWGTATGLTSKGNDGAIIKYGP